MQNVILARTQRELWNQYAWPHLDYHVDFDLPANTQFVAFDATMPFENITSLWRNYNPSNQQPWIQLRYGFEDSINEMLHSYPPTRWRNVVTVDATTGLTNFAGQAQIWPIPSQLSHMRWHGQAPLNPLKVDTDQCMIDSTAIVLTCAAELLGAQKSECGVAKGQQSASLHSAPCLADRERTSATISAMGQGRTAQPTNFMQGATPYIGLHTGALNLMPSYIKLKIFRKVVSI